MKMNSVKLKSFLQKTTFKIGVILSVLILLSFVDSNALAEDNDVSQSSQRFYINVCDNHSTHYIREDEIILSDDQLKGIPDYFAFDNRRNRPYRVIGIDANETETLVDFIVRPSHDPGWLIFSEKTFLRDQTTNDMYKVRSIEGGIPLGELLIIKGRRGQSICFTLVFPPLGKGVKKIDVIELMSETVTSPSSSRMSWLTEYNVNVKNMQVEKEESYRIIE